MFRLTTTIGALLLIVALAPMAANAATVPGEALTIKKVETLVDDLVDLLMTVAALAVVAFIVYGGAKMAMSAGNDAEFKKGKDILRNAVIGGLVIFGVGVIVNTIVKIAQQPSDVIDGGVQQLPAGRKLPGLQQLP